MDIASVSVVVKRRMRYVNSADYVRKSNRGACNRRCRKSEDDDLDCKVRLEVGVVQRFLGP